MMYKLDELTDAQALKRLHIYKDRDCKRCFNYQCGDFLDVIIEKTPPSAGVMAGRSGSRSRKR